jgi:hypothetical protein
MIGEMSTAVTGDPEPTRHLNGGGPDSATDIERLLPGLQARQGEELLRRAAATGMDHALAEHG